MKIRKITKYICISILFVCQSTFVRAEEVARPFVDQPVAVMWSGDGFALMEPDGKKIVYKCNSTEAIREVLALPGATGFSVWHGITSSLRLHEGRIVFSKRFSDGSGEDYPTSLVRHPGNDDLQGIPFGLWESSTPGRYFAFNYFPGFNKSNDASPCSWWKQGSNGTLEPDSIVPIELNDNLFIPERAGPGKMAINRLRLNCRGLLPFLGYPIRVKGAFIVVSYGAGIVWVISDDKSIKDRTVELISLEKDIISGKVEHLPVILGIQPMPNGHLLVAMRTKEFLIINQKSTPNPQSNDHEGTIENLPETKENRSEIIWKDIDPFDGKVDEADPTLLVNAPKILSQKWQFSFYFNLEGELVFPGDLPVKWDKIPNLDSPNGLNGQTKEGSDGIQRP